jgi:hypothetical protein
MCDSNFPSLSDYLRNPITDKFVVFHHSPTTFLQEQHIL